MLGGNVDSSLTAQRPVPASDPPTTGTMPSAGRVAACPPCSVGSVGSVHGTGGSCSASGCSSPSPHPRVRAFGADTSNDLTLPGTGSQAAKDLLADEFPPQQNGANPIVFDVTQRQAHRRRPTSRRSTTSVKAIEQAAARLQRHQPAQQQRPDRGCCRRTSRRRSRRCCWTSAPATSPPRLAQHVIDAAAPGARRPASRSRPAGSIGTTLSTSRRPRAARSSASSPR